MALTHAAAYSVWVVYDHPTDLTSPYAARRHEMRADGARPTGDLITGGTLQEVHNRMPKGLVCFPPAKDEDPKILEVWL